MQVKGTLPIVVGVTWPMAVFQILLLLILEWTCIALPGFNDNLRVQVADKAVNLL